MSAFDEAMREHGSLQQALLQIARSRASETADVARITEVWQSMLDGRWSIAEQFDCDGHRYVLVRRRTAGSASVASLSSREWQVLALARRGHSNKVIAHDLDISVSAVSTYLARARKKLGVQESLEALGILGTLRQS
jgi:DNA-binding NarL/FixJ family response regulator